MTDQKQDNCPICQKVFHRFPMGEKNGFALVACKICGSVMVEPAVTDKIREEYFGEIEPQITHAPNPDKEIADRKKAILKALPEPAGKRFLDVGSQNGYAVMAAKELGMTVYGIDSHEFFVDFAKKKYPEELFENVTAQEYAKAQLPKADLVYANECFCMQTDLEGFAAALGSLVAPGGKLYIDEPDGNNFNVPRKFSSWQMVFPPINFIYLSKKGLIALLKRHGFAIKKTFFTWGPMTRLVAVRKK